MQNMYEIEEFIKASHATEIEVYSGKYRYRVIH